MVQSNNYIIEHSECESCTDLAKKSEGNSKTGQNAVCLEVEAVVGGNPIELKGKCTYDNPNEQYCTIGAFGLGSTN